jgi:hypothetical protein
MQTHLTSTAASQYSASTRLLLEARASSSAVAQPRAVEDEVVSGAGDGAGVVEASPSLSNGGNNDNDAAAADGKRKTSPPRESGEQAAASSELPGRKARVSVRARSEAPMVINSLISFLLC